MQSGDRADENPEFEGYRVIQRLRSGPVTDLYRGELETLGRPVFIKALGHGILPSSPFAAALEREARLLVELDHPSVLRLLDFVRNDSAMWLVLEHVDGFTLDEILAKKGKLSPAGAAAVGLALAEGLSHAHAHGIVHRDVQPHNVLVSRRGAVKLANFAAAADERLPTAPELLEGSAGFGTPAYMSPEQLFGEPEDPRSDLFSLGIVLWEMITGKRPFDAPDDRAASHKIRHDPVPHLARLVPDVPAALDRVVRRCLEKMPSDRYASADELVRALAEQVAESGHASAEAGVRAELERLGLAAQGGARRESRTPAHKAPPTLRTALSGYLFALGLLVAGGSFIQYRSIASHGDGAPRGGARLELLPARPAYLKVVADPWAHVIIDGEQVDTTPFARPIPLPAGTHYVRLEHPAAPTERRTVTLSAGETVLVDVKMDVSRPRVTAPVAPSAATLTDPKTP